MDRGVGIAAVDVVLGCARVLAIAITLLVLRWLGRVREAIYADRCDNRHPMRERRPLLLGVAVFALLVGAGSGLTSPVGAQVPLASGRFVSVCEFSHQSMNDPIVYPGKPGKSHLHEFFGNASTNAYSTPK